MPTTETRLRYLGFGTFLMALLQALCPAVIAFGAVRVAMGWELWRQQQVRMQRRQDGTRIWSGSR